MSNLSELLPSGGGQNVLSMTATGNISGGQPVILNSDGTVSVPSASGQSYNLGSAQQIDGGNNTYGPVGAYDSTNNKVVVAYRADSGGALTVVAGTVSGATITFGTPETAVSGSNATHIRLAYNPNKDAFLVTFKNQAESNYGQLMPFKIDSGTTFSFGTKNSFHSGNMSNNGQVVYEGYYYYMQIFYKSSSNNRPTVKYWSFDSGLSGHLGSDVQLSTDDTSRMDAAYCSHQQRILVIFTNSSQSDRGDWVLVSTASNGTPSVEGSGDLGSSDFQYPSVVHIPDVSSQFVIAGRDSGLNQIDHYVITIGSATIEKSSVQTLSQRGQNFDLTYDSALSKFILTYDDFANSYNGYYVVGTVSGTGTSATISFATPVVFHNSGSIEHDYAFPQNVYDPDTNQTLLIYRNRTSTEGNVQTLALEYSSTTLTSTNCVGLAKDAISNGSAGDVNLFGGIATSSSFIAAAISAGTPVNYEAANVASGYAIAYDAANYKVLIVYNDGGNSQYGTAIVGTVSGTSISFGSPSVFNSAATTEMDVAFDVNAGKFVIVYKDANSSFQGRANVATISGTSVSFGSQATLENAVITAPSGVYDANAQKTVFAYYSGSGGSSSSVAAVGTISGTDVSFGTPVQFSASTSTYQAIAYDSTAQKVVIAFTDSTNSNYPSAIVGTVSGTSISFGSAQSIESVVGAPIAITYDSGNGKHIVVYREMGSSPYGMHGAVGTVSGTSISFGTPVANSGATNVGNMAIAYHTASGSAVVHYRSEDTGTKPMAGLVTVSGTSLSFGTPIELEDVSGGVIQSGHASVYDSQNQKVVAIYTDNTAGVYGDAAVIDVATGLTIGSDYYAQSDGTISTTSTSPAVLLGQAISTTTINMRNLT